MIDEKAAQELLRRLASGELSESERDRLEERLLLEDGVFDQVLAAEDDLVDAYVRDELSPDERQSFEQRLTGSPWLRDRVALARSLSKIVSDDVADVKMEGVADKEPVARPWWRTRVAPERRWVAVAAVALLAVTAAGWLLNEIRPWRDPGNGVRGKAIEIVLSPTGQRSVGETERLSLSEDITRVELLLDVLEVAEGREGLYQAEISDERDAILMRWEDLRQEEQDWGPAVRLQVPAARLRDGFYQVVLFAQDSNGDYRAPSVYPFAVDRGTRLKLPPVPPDDVEAPRDLDQTGENGLEDAVPLAPGSTFETELLPGETDVFALDLEAGQYLYVAIVQLGVDLTLRLLEPAGRAIAEADLYYRPDGTEELYGFPRRSGVHRLEIRAKPSEGEKGRYRLSFAELRAERPDDRRRAAGWVAYAEAVEKKRSRDPQALRQAIDLFAGTVDLWRQLEDPLWEASTLDNLGRCHQILEENALAKPYFEQALPAWRQAGKQAYEALTFNNLALAQRALGDFGQAEASFAQALALYNQVGDVEGEATVRFNLGNLLSASGRLEPALEQFRRAGEIHRALENRLGLARVLSGRGTTYTHFGRIPDALRSLEASYEILAGRTDRSSRLDKAAVLANLGVAHEWSGDRTKALGFYRRSLELNRELGHRTGEAAVLANLAYVYRQLGDLEEAFRNEAAALEIHRQIDRQDDVARTLMNLGYIRFLQGKPEEALVRYEDALAILRALGSTAAEVLTLEKIGEAHATTGRSKAARMAYDEALRVSKTVDERRWSSRIHLGLGDLDLAAGDLGAARAAFDLALDLSRDQGDPTGETLALAGLARAARHEGRLAAAADRADEALHRIESLRANAGTEHSRATYLAKHRPIYELAIEVAMERHRREPGGGHDGSALGLAERARARVLLEELADMRADLRDDVDPDLLERERSLEQRIRSRERYRFEKARRMNAAARVELGREISELIVEQREVREAIRRSSPRFAALHQPSPLNLEGIQREVLDRDTTLLEYFLGEERSFLWVVSSHSLDSFELPPRVEIETLALRIYELVKAASERPGLATVEQRRAQQEERAAADDALRRAGRQLSQMVLGPAAEVLRGKRLVVVADGALQYLPFGALPLPGNNGGTGSGSEPPLLRDYEVVHLPSASALASVRQAAEGRLTAKKSIAILADPVFRAGELRTRPRRAGEVGQKAPPDRAEGNRETWSPAVRSARDTYLGSLVRLPATTEEALAIARLAPEGDAFTALGLDASRPTAMSPELRDYRFVHFATHGLMHSQHPELSGVVLSLVDEQGRPREGLLTLRDIYTLRLRAELVVLSACQTALGAEIAGEGLMGLPRGFFYAGAPRVIASLWKVDDRATAELMSFFYRELLQAKRRPAEALRQAQLAMWRDSERWQDPYYWAAFALYGEWR